MRYAIIVEKAAANYSAHVPDPPGCIATGSSLEQVEVEIREAIAFHIDGSAKMARRCRIPAVMSNAWKLLRRAPGHGVSQ